VLTRALGRTPYYVVAGGLAVIFLFPLVWNAWASVSGQPGTAQESGYGLGNYRTLLDYDAGLWQYFLNSTVVSVLTVVLTLGVSLLGGYAFARFDFPGKNLLFLLTLAILMVPYATLLIPLYVLLGRLHLQNSLIGLSLVLAMFQLPFATFMMRISFEAVPRELEESALVDGCGTAGALRRILLPIARRKSFDPIVGHPCFGADDRGFQIQGDGAGAAMTDFNPEEVHGSCLESQGPSAGGKRRGSERTP
jgi:multiple sugar transport system permease protein